MNHTVTEIAVGAASPFTLLHISDIHLTLSDERDSESLRALAAKRALRYTHSESVLQAATQMSKAKNALIVNTGDMTDFYTPANAERIAAFMVENDCMFVTGNHDFRPDGGMAFDVPSVREAQLPKVQALYANPIRFCSRILNGVNLVGMDNAYYRFEAWQLDALKAEVAKGLPIILFLHIPLFEEGLYHLIVQGKRRHASLVSVPEDWMTDYPPERFEQQIEDEITHTVVEFIKHEPTVKILFAGHLHKSYQAPLEGGLLQVCTAIDEVREIIVK